MKKIFTWIILAFSIHASASAGQVTFQDAQRAAVNFFFERINQYKPVAYNSIKITETFLKKDGDQTLYYIFNIDPQGYIIVSADDAAIPVLAYSFETGYNAENAAPQFTAWMNQCADQIRFAVSGKISRSGHVSGLWDHLLTLNEKKLIPLKDQRSVVPFIYSNWDQGALYNEMCPADAAGPGGHVYAGCVPTAMGQIMYYYRWPDHGTGSYTDIDPVYGSLHANFDTTWYQWDNMKNSITKSNPGIAELLYHLGVSCDLVYGPAGSGMYNHKSAYALKTFFKYSPETRYIFRDSTNLNWDSIIVAHLDRKMPLYYAGWSVPNINGHAFVCDGYQGGDYFHFNFGWSGNSNGYFYTDSIVTGSGSFNLAQELIVNIFPDTLNYSYPQYCVGTTHLMFNQGSFEDGSGPMKNYQSGSNCRWLIDPQSTIDSISSITLSFDHFETLPGDVVNVYDGSSESSPLLGSFSGNTIPASLTSTGNKILVTFIATSGSDAPGWSATYTTTSPTWCKNVSTISADTLDLTDGSFGFNYHNNTSCRWNLKTTSGDTLTVNFRSFDTEPGKDVLRIYDAENMDSLAFISGHYDSLNPPPPVVSPSGKMLLLFITNSSITGKGWHLYYPKSTVGIQDQNSNPVLKVFPNPAKEIVTLQFSLRKATGIELELSTMQGRTIFHKELNGNPGKNTEKLDVSDFYPGIYLLTFKSKEFYTTQKIVITK